jgi:hypothetical protein
MCCFASPVLERMILQSAPATSETPCNQIFSHQEHRQGRVLRRSERLNFRCWPLDYEAGSISKELGDRVEFASLGVRLASRSDRSPILESDSRGEIVAIDIERDVDILRVQIRTGRII